MISYVLLFLCGCLARWFFGWRFLCCGFLGEALAADLRTGLVAVALAFVVFTLRLAAVVFGRVTRGLDFFDEEVLILSHNR